MKYFIKVFLASFLSLFYKIDKNRIIFTSGNDSFDYNAKYLFQYFLQQQETKRNCYFVINSSDKRGELITSYGDYFIETESIKGIMFALLSYTWITSAGLPVYRPLLSRRRKIFNIWHGMPLKKICLSDNNFSIIKRLYFKLIFSYNYSYLFITSDFFRAFYREAFAVSDDKIVIQGQARNDLLFETNSRERFLKQNYGIIDAKNIVLYAPTHRKGKEVKLFPFDGFDMVDFNNYLKTNNTYILLRSHKYDSEDSIQEMSNIRFCNQDIVEDISSILNIFDGVITDYSSIFIDYILLERPILFVPYDLEEYRKSIGFYFEYDETLPGTRCYTQEDFYTFLNSLHTLPEEEIEKLKMNNWKYNLTKSDFRKANFDFIMEKVNE